MSDLPTFAMRDLIEAGVHFGHKTMRWNPKMQDYIYGERSGVHIIDLQQTVPLMYRALNVLQDVVKQNGKVLFVGTKRQASPLIKETAEKCGQFYVNHRWLGGMLTNWKTVSQSIKTMNDIDEALADPERDLSKKERLSMTRHKEKLVKSLGGIKEMGGLPDVIFVVDTNREELAITEANRLGIPVIAVIDSNSNPDGVDFPIPGNDDATRAIKLYLDLASEAILSGLQAGLAASGVDLGASEEAPQEALPEKKETKKAGPTVEVKKKIATA